MRSPLLALVAATVVAVLSACSAPVAVRTTPDQVERAAVSQAQARARQSGLTVSDGLWTQLWTPAQGANRIAACVAQRSGDTIRFSAYPDRQDLSFTASLTVGTPNGSPFVIDPALVRQIIDGCYAVYPIDFRLASVPRRDRDALYSYDVTTLRRCLIARGQKVPPLPSRAQFLQQQSSRVPWNAYDLVTVRNRDAWYALSDACPLIPSGITLG